MIEVVAAGSAGLMSGLRDKMLQGGGSRALLYSGVRPAASAAPSVLLIAQVLFASDVGVVNGLGDLILSTGTASILLQTTTPTWARVVNGNDEHLFDCDVRLSGAADMGQELVITTTATIAGALVLIVGGTFSARP